MTEEYLSQRAFAALPEVGVSHVRINKLIKEGRLPTSENGKIPKSKGIEAWKTCRVIGFEKAGAAGAKYGGPKVKAKPETEDENGDDEDEEAPAKGNYSGRLNKAKAEKEEVLAEHKKLELAILKRDYILIAQVKDDAQKLAAMIRQKIISVAPIIAANSEGKNSSQIQRIVEIELNEALKDLQKLEM